jgi:hypothetical protein
MRPDVESNASLHFVEATHGLYQKLTQILALLDKRRREGSGDEAGSK